MPRDALAATLLTDGFQIAGYLRIAADVNFGRCISSANISTGIQVSIDLHRNRVVGK